MRYKNSEPILAGIYEAVNSFNLMEWADLYGNVKETRVNTGDIVKVYAYPGGCIGYIKVRGIEVGSIGIISSPEWVFNNCAVIA